MNYPKYCVLIGMNHILIDRIHSESKSNNNTIIRPGAIEFIKLLYCSNLFHIGFYACMNNKNLKKTVKIVLQGYNTNMTISKNISFISNLSINEDSADYYVMKSKSILIERINEQVGS